MNPKHAEAFRELREWCRKWDAEILYQQEGLSYGHIRITFRSPSGEFMSHALAGDRFNATVKYLTYHGYDSIDEEPSK